MARVDSFPNCCGLLVISQFLSFQGIYGGTYTTEIKEELKRYIKEKISNKGIGMYLAAVNSVQEEDGKLSEIFLELGFKDLTGAFYHPGHGHTITLYGYECYPEKRPKIIPPPVPKVQLEGSPVQKEEPKKKLLKKKPLKKAKEVSRWGFSW